MKKTLKAGNRRTLATAAPRAWGRDQVRLFVKDVRRFAGDGWDWMVPAVRRALIAERAFAVCRGQHRDSVSIVAMDYLLNDMLAEAGLTEET